MIADILLKVQKNEYLSEEEMLSCMSAIMEGEWSNEQIAALLMGLSMRGETVDEITGAARVMRDKALPINAPDGAVDCCGTGGDKSGTYNISTAVAIVAAACGVPVAKHGNRSASSKSGAADVLEALGVNLDVSQEKLEEAITAFNFAFLMAPRHHEAVKYVVPVRKALGVRTMFNILGPLANPAKTKFQLLGVYDRALVMPVAQVLQKLGTKAAWVVHGSDGLDEITTTGETYIAKLSGDTITEETISPKDFGLSVSDPKDLVGGLPDENANALNAVLDGVKNAYRDIVIMNTAAVLLITGKEQSYKQAAAVAAHALDSGEARKKLDEYVEYTQNVAG
ncbi:MAG: anthranilate phosphoribosyltransferase [Alcanivorax sp.]